MGDKPGILIVEDEAIVADDMAWLVREIGLEVCGIVASGARAVEEAGKSVPDLVLMDVNLNGDMDGFQAADLIMKEVGAPVVFVTAMADEGAHEGAFDHQPYGWLIKPFSEVEFKTTTLTALNRARIERRLRESEEMFRRLAHFAPIGISIMAPNNTFLYFNPGFTGILGYTLEDIPDEQTWLKKTCPEDFPGEIIGAEPVGEVEARVFSVKCKDGAEKTIAVRTVITEKGMRVITYEDITERIRAEKELKAGRERLQTLFKAFPDAMAISDMNGGLVEMNDTLCRLSGYSRDELLGTPGMELGLWVDPCAREKMMDELSSDGVCKSFEAQFKLKNGDVRSALVSARMVELDGEPKVLSFAKDIEEWKRDKRALGESRQLYRALTENAGDLIVRLDEVFTNHYLSPAIRTILGYEPDELRGLSNVDIVHPDDRRQWIKSHEQALLAPEKTVTATYRIKRKDGEYVWLETNAKAIQDHETGRVKEIVAVSRDVTDRQNKQAQAIHAEKLMAVGELAGGVAHNFNNVLQIVLGNTNLAMSNLEMGAYGEVSENLAQILESSKYASETVRRLQSFAGASRTVNDATMFDLSATVEQALNMTKVWWKTKPEANGVKIEVSTDLAPGCYVKGRESELFEVVVNLIKNGCEAMEGGGALRLRAGIVNSDVALSVTDTGTGVSEENKGKIFLPFFTTKGFDSAGMGLASSHGIVRDHGGAITLDSEPGKGASFTVTLPLAPAPSNEGKPQACSKFKPGLRILVVDDAEPVLNMLTKALTQLKQIVLPATNGELALEMWDKEDIDLIICDLGMPGLSGWGVGKRLRRMERERGRPRTPFVLITGWGGQKEEKEKIDEAGVDYIIEKPVDIRDLARVLNSIEEE